MDPEMKAIPGPGSYKTRDSSFSAEKGIKISEKFKERISEAPGPASYNLNYSFVKTASIALSMA